MLPSIHHDLRENRESPIQCGVYAHMPGSPRIPESSWESSYAVIRPRVRGRRFGSKEDVGVLIVLVLRETHATGHVTRQSMTAAQSKEAQSSKLKEKKERKVNAAYL